MLTVIDKLKLADEYLAKADAILAELNSVQLDAEAEKKKLELALKKRASIKTAIEEKKKKIFEVLDLLLLFVGRSVQLCGQGYADYPYRYKASDRPNSEPCKAQKIYGGLITPVTGFPSFYQFCEVALVAVEETGDSKINAELQGEAEEAKKLSEITRRLVTLLKKTDRLPK